MHFPKLRGFSGKAHGIDDLQRLGVEKRLRNSIGMQQKKAEALCAHYREDYFESKVDERVLACMEQQTAYDGLLRRREASNAVVRAYQRDGGICDMLQNVTAFVADHMDGIDDAGLLVRFAYNGNLGMAAYQLRKLEAEREEILNKPLAKTGKREFLEHLGWVFVDEKLTEYQNELTRMQQRLSEDDPDRYERRINAIQAALKELERVSQFSNYDKLRQIERALHTHENEQIQDETDLLHALQTCLSAEALAGLGAEETNIDEYKARLKKYADEVEAAVLGKWPKQ